METFSVVLAICARNSPVTGEFPAQRPVTRGFDVFFDLRLNERLSKQSWSWWFEMPSCQLWRHSNVQTMSDCVVITVCAEGLAPSGARTSAGNAQTKSVLHIYPVMAVKAWLGNDTITIIGLIFT